MNTSKFPRWFIALVPLLLIGIAVAAFQWKRVSATSLKLQENVTYEVWLTEAEVAPFRADGSGWDTDGSAPDLVGVMVWQNQRILETVTAQDGLIARWDPVAVKMTQILHGEADTASVRRVGHVRVTANGFLEIGVFDDDLATRELAGGFRVPFTALRVGNNELQGKNTLKRLQIVIAEPGKDGGSTQPWQVGEGATELAEAPAAMLDHGTRLIDDAAKAAAKAADGATKEMGKQLEEGTKAAKDWLRKQLDQ
jgi:hypothetical protein